MATQYFKINLFFRFVWRRGKNISLVCFLLLLKREIKKMSDICSLFPSFGDPWLSCLLPSHYHLSIAILLFAVTMRKQKSWTLSSLHCLHRTHWAVLRPCWSMTKGSESATPLCLVSNDGWSSSLRIGRKIDSSQSLLLEMITLGGDTGVEPAGHGPTTWRAGDTGWLFTVLWPWKLDTQSS